VYTRVVFWYIVYNKQIRKIADPLTAVRSPHLLDSLSHSTTIPPLTHPPPPLPPPLCSNSHTTTIPNPSFHPLFLVQSLSGGVNSCTNHTMYQQPITHTHMTHIQSHSPVLLMLLGQISCCGSARVFAWCGFRKRCSSFRNGFGNGAVEIASGCSNGFGNADLELLLLLEMMRLLLLQHQPQLLCSVKEHCSCKVFLSSVLAFSSCNSFSLLVQSKHNPSFQD
jgi:hypothetical protein